MSGDGMSDFVSALTPASGAGINSTTLWGELVNAAPIIIGVFVFAFGYRVVRKVLKSASKGKANI